MKTPKLFILLGIISISLFFFIAGLFDNKLKGADELGQSSSRSSTEIVHENTLLNHRNDELLRENNYLKENISDLKEKHKVALNAVKLEKEKYFALDREFENLKRIHNNLLRRENLDNFPSKPERRFDNFDSYRSLKNSSSEDPCTFIQNNLNAEIAVNYHLDPTSLRGYGIQMGAYKSACNALSYMQTLSESLQKNQLYISTGYSAKKRRKLFFVTFGNFNDEFSARALINDLKASNSKFRKIIIYKH